ncbi:MAG: hypothetical protein HDP34_03525 [Clostridia bacterium]|nr:hypothetical protein [Clostridia bacterium]
MFTREEFENLINNSPLFYVDKDSNSELYKTEKYALFTLLTDYYHTCIFPRKPLEDYSYTLIETAAECLKYYDKSKGEFLHLFNKAMKRNLGIAKAKELIDKHRQGIKLSTYDEQMVRKVISLANSKNLDIHDRAVQTKMAVALGIGADRLAELIRINDDAVAVSATVANDDGDEVELFDLQASKTDTLEEIITKDGLNELILQIDSVFQTVQARQKQLLSLLLTIEIVKALEYDIKATVNLLHGYAFFNTQITDWCEKHGGIPTAKQIGEICGVSEQSLSRTYKNFKEKVLREVKKISI